MNDQQAFQALKKFFEERPVSLQAADSLRKGVEIGVIINNNLRCAFYKDGNQPHFDLREPKSPDVIFYFSPEAVESLVNDPSEQIADLGINVVKNYLAGNVKIKVVGSMISLLTNGYLGVIKSGGVSFAKFLASHGVSGLSRIKEIIQKLMSKS